MTRNSIDMSYTAREELFDNTSYDSNDWLPDEAHALSLPPLGEEGYSTSHAGRADEAAFEEMVRRYATINSQTHCQSNYHH